jgi:starch-binding outer membrane protein, SusD/RagB family
MKEFIFPMPYDASPSNDYMDHARYDLNCNLGVRYLYSGSAPGGNVDPALLTNNYNLH